MRKFILLAMLSVTACGGQQAVAMRDAAISKQAYKQCLESGKSCERQRLAYNADAENLATWLGVSRK